MAAMSKNVSRKKGERGEPRAAIEPAAPVTARGWAKLAGLGALSGLWSLFLWMELVLLRTGGSSFCATGGKLDCSSIWNGSFASTVHRATGLPIAGWGLVWSVTAFALPLAGLLRSAERRESGALVSATRLTAVAGLLTIAVMIAQSAIAGAICIGCIGTYLIVAAYAAIALLLWRPAGFPEVGRGAGLAGTVTVAAFLLLLYPGLRTPKSSGEAGRQAITAAATRSAAAPEVPASNEKRGTGDAQRDKLLSDLVTSLDPSLKQTLADSLAIYRSSSRQELSPPRALVGSDLAPVRITEFTDILCEHCASLHQTLQTLRENVSPGSYSVDARQFPLDGRCNRMMEPYKGDDVRCVSAKLRIAAEPLGKEPQLAAALFEKQEGLTHDKALQIASRFLTKDQIQAALSSPAVEATLQQDIATAARFDSDGTPIVALNGQKGTSFGPFLYAMVLTRGNPDHPAFDALPPGNPTAHLH